MHPSHQSQLARLNRASGQIEAVKRMINDQKYCVDILNQLRAARCALKAIELAVLETHMKSCLDKASELNQDNQANSASQTNQAKKIKEIINLLKKYE